MFLYLLLGFILVLYICFSFVSRKYSNPYKFYFIFGKKGSGKSCYMVRQMLKYKKRGYTIYTDMPVYIDGVRIIKDANSLFKEFTPEPHSAIFLDEIGLTWHSRDFKKFDKRILEWFKYQRKYKCVCFANSQSFDVDLQLRLLSDGLILQTNIGNVISISRPIIRSVTVTDANFTGESKIVDQLQFAKFWHWRFYYMPKYFKYFKSFDAPDRPMMPYVESHFKVDNPRSRRLFLQSCDKELRSAIRKEGL